MGCGNIRNGSWATSATCGETETGVWSDPGDEDPGVWDPPIVEGWWTPPDDDAATTGCDSGSVRLLAVYQAVGRDSYEDSLRDLSGNGNTLYEVQDPISLEQGVEEWSTTCGWIWRDAQHNDCLASPIRIPCLNQCTVIMGMTIQTDTDFADAYFGTRNVASAKRFVFRGTGSTFETYEAFTGCGSVSDGAQELAVRDIKDNPCEPGSQFQTERPKVFAVNGSGWFADGVRKETWNPGCAGVPSTVDFGVGAEITTDPVVTADGAQVYMSAIAIYNGNLTEAQIAAISAAMPTDDYLP